MSERGQWPSVTRVDALSGHVLGGSMAGEGTPDDPAQARMQMSIHVKVVGLSLVLRGTFQSASSDGRNLVS